MSNVVDITSPAEPISLARDMVERAPGCKAAIAVLVLADGTIWSDCNGHARMEILWALEKMKMQILANDDEF